MITQEHVEYYSTRERDGQWLICMAGRPIWLGDGHWVADSEQEARKLVAEKNASLRPSMGGQCPMCGSDRTYVDSDGWLCCMHCGSRSK